METPLDYNELDAALRELGSTWGVSQAHGLLCSRLSILGPVAVQAWSAQLLPGGTGGDALQRERLNQLDAMFQSTRRQLAERHSEFVILLPDDDEPADQRAEALAHWCEGFLHGLVSGEPDSVLRERLAREPLSDVIKDMLQITRAVADVDADDETNESAYVELVEFVRVAVQLTYEELAELRDGAGEAAE